MDILITGSSRGIGLAAAKSLKAMGHRVLITARDKNILEKAAKSIGADFYGCDLSISKNVQLLYDYTMDNGYQIDALIHALGGVIQGDSHPITPRLLNDSMQLNLNSGLQLNNLVIPNMINKGTGRIIHISSQAGVDGNSSPAYAISKAALNIYVKNAARFYAKNNIMICGIIPGILDHEGSAWHDKKIKSPERYKSVKSQSPLNRFLKPDDLSEYISFLTTDKSIAYTGSLIEIKGGV